MANITSSFPIFSGANWWRLRAKFKTAYPKAAITEEYLASVLGMQIQSVKNNGTLANLRTLGLLDEENKCTNLANKWRLDDSYAEACNEMRGHVYPAELTDIGTDRDAISTWFMNKSGAGESLANKLTALYLILSNPEIKDPTQKGKASSKALDKQEKSTKNNVESKNSQEVHIKRDSAPLNPSVPSMNINLQIHISAEASLEQIDQIFSSMAKHLYGRE